MGPPSRVSMKTLFAVPVRNRSPHFETSWATRSLHGYLTAERLRGSVGHLPRRTRSIFLRMFGLRTRADLSPDRERTKSATLSASISSGWMI